MQHRKGVFKLTQNRGKKKGELFSLFQRIYTAPVETQDWKEVLGIQRYLREDSTTNVPHQSEFNNGQ